MNEYFPHDINASHDPKIGALLEDHGAPGYALYWVIIEMLHKEHDQKLPLLPYIYKAIASILKLTPGKVEEIIKDCIELYVGSDGIGLFYRDGASIGSRRVDHNMAVRSELQKKKSYAGKMRHRTNNYPPQGTLIVNEEQVANPGTEHESDAGNDIKDESLQIITTSAEQNSAPAQQDSAHVEQNAAKEIKEKEKKVKEKKVKENKEIKEYKEVEHLCLRMNYSLQNAIKEHIANRLLLRKPFTAEGFDRFLKKLVELSKNNETTATKIIQQSVDNRYPDIYPLNNYNNGNISNSKTGRYSQGVSKEFIERNEAILRGEYP